MKTVCSTTFHLVSEDYDFQKESVNIEKLIAIVRKRAKEAEENCEVSFICHIIAIRTSEHTRERITGVKETYELRKVAPFATFCYTSDGELNIDYHLNFE